MEIVLKQGHAIVPIVVEDHINMEMLLQHPGSPDSRDRRRHTPPDGPDLRYAQALMKQIEDLREQPSGAWPSPYALAEALRRLGAQLEYPGWYELARLAYLEAIEVYREDGADVADDYLDDYSRILRSLGQVLEELRRYEDALPIVHEERLVNLRLAVVDTSGLDMANDARTTFIRILVRLGRYREALGSAAEAVREIRLQPAGGPGRSKDYTLAYALGRFADCLTSAGRFDEAVDAATEAEGIWRRYNDASDEPDWLINAGHHGALERLGEALAQAGRYEEAHAVLVERVEMCRQSIDTDEGFVRLRDLADTLNNVAISLKRLGRYHEALSAAEEAVRLNRVLAARALDRQHRFERLFPGEEEFLNAGDQPMGRELFEDGGLSELNELFEDDELDEEFLETIEFDDEVRGGHLSGFRAKVREAELSLCVSLYNLGSVLHVLNRLEKALAVDCEAVEIARRQQDAAQLSLALNNKACDLTDLGRHEEALKAALEAVDLLIPLTATAPETHERTLGLTLHTLSVSACGLNPHKEVVLTASLQCLALYRRLYQRDPQRLAADFAHALTDHGLIRAQRGEHAKAQAATAKAVEMYRRLATQHPARHNSGYANALLAFAQVRTVAVDAHANGRAAAEEAVALLQSLAASVPEVHEHRLPHAHSVLRLLS